MSSAAQSVRVEHDGPVYVISLDRPDARHAVDGLSAQALADAFRACDADATLGVAVFHGAFGQISAGADLKAGPRRFTTGAGRTGARLH
jgi:enoyl-CoA hydratase